MDALRRFEELVEGMVEGSLAEAMTSRLQPVEIAKKLARAMDNGQTISAGKTLVPNDYQVMLSSADTAAFAPFRQSLEQELTAYLRAAARERGFSFIARPRVAIIENGRLRARRVLVSAALVDVKPAAPQSEEAQHTAAIPLEEIRAHLEQAASLLLPDGRVVALDKPVISIGRSLDNDVVIDDKRVSRRHAQVRLLPGSAAFYDLASANGSMINGQPVEQVALRDGDRISLGGVELLFHREAQERKRAG